MEKAVDIDLESELQSMFESSDEAEFVVAQLNMVSGDIRREGAAVYSGSAKVGKLSYYLHWHPPAVLCHCDCHTNCYVTAPLWEIDEDLLVQWVGKAAAYRTAADHLRFVPEGCYQRRRTQPTRFR